MGFERRLGVVPRSRWPGIVAVFQVLRPLYSGQTCKALGIAQFSLTLFRNLVIPYFAFHTSSLLVWIQVAFQVSMTLGMFITPHFTPPPPHPTPNLKDPRICTHCTIPAASLASCSRWRTRKSQLSWSYRRFPDLRHKYGEVCTPRNKSLTSIVAPAMALLGMLPDLPRMCLNRGCLEAGPVRLND